MSLPVTTKTNAQNIFRAYANKIKDATFSNEKDVITHKLNVDPGMVVSNIASQNPVYLFENENLAYISDVPEATNKGITYKVENGLIYASGTATATFYVNTDLVIPENIVNQSVLVNIEIVSGTITAGNVKLQTPLTYKNSGGNEAQLSAGIDGCGNLKAIGFTQNQQRIQFQSTLVCENLVLRPYLAFRCKDRTDAGWANKPTARRRVASGTIENTTGTLITATGNFSAHVKNKQPMNELFGKRLALCGDSIAEGHSGDSFGWTIAETQNMSFDKPAIGTSQIASSSPVTSILDQVDSLNGKDYDYILVEGGINDALNNATLGAITDGYGATLDASTTIGGLELICKTLIEDHPNAKKLFIFCHRTTSKNHTPHVQQQTYFEAMIPVLEKWHIPYIDIRNYPLCAYNDDYTAAYFGTDALNGPSLHPNNAGYALGYIGPITDAMLFGSVSNSGASEEGSGSLNNGTAVVFGDSLFDNEVIGYSFADYLRNTRLYDAVYDHAKAGSGFGNTGNSSYQMSLLVQDPDIQEEITNAKAIYMSLGFNDIMTAVGAVPGVTEDHLIEKIQSVFDTINDLNPSVTIYFLCAYDTKVFASLVAQCPSTDVDATLPQTSSMTKGQSRDILWYGQIIESELCVAKGNILQCNIFTPFLINDSPDGIHPSAENYPAIFHEVVYGGYGPFMFRCMTPPNPSVPAELIQYGTLFNTLLSAGKIDMTDFAIASYDFYNNNQNVSFYLVKPYITANSLINSSDEFWSNKWRHSVRVQDMRTGNGYDLRQQVPMATTDPLPTASADYSEALYQYFGSGNTYSYGAIYCCRQVNGTWTWVRLTVPMADLKALVASSTDFADFKTKIAALN